MGTYNRCIKNRLKILNHLWKKWKNVRTPQGGGIFFDSHCMSDLLSTQSSSTNIAARRFSCCAPAVWNSPPSFIRTADSFTSFRFQFKTSTFTRHHHHLKHSPQDRQKKERYCVDQWLTVLMNHTFCLLSSKLSILSSWKTRSSRRDSSRHASFTTRYG